MRRDKEKESGIRKRRTGRLREIELLLLCPPFFFQGWWAYQMEFMSAECAANKKDLISNPVKVYLGSSPAYASNRNVGKWVS